MTNAELSHQIALLFGGNGLSTAESRARVEALLAKERPVADGSTVTVLIALTHEVRSFLDEVYDVDAGIGGMVKACAEATAHLTRLGAEPS